MKYLLRTATMASVLALGVVGAQAADLTYEPAPVAPEVFSWTGLYIGVHGGLGGGEFDSSFKDDWAPGWDNWSQQDNAFGFFGGAQIGYNYQFAPNWVVGAEADLALANIEAKHDIVETNDDGDYARQSTEVEWFGTIRGRLGYAMDNVLFYGTGGAAYGSVKTSFDQGDDFGSYDGAFSASDTQWGWTAGAGVEYAITKNVTLKAEYLYVDLGSADYTVSDDGPFFDDGTISLDTAFHTLKAGLNYKF
ncbi:outer membrane protein [Kaistia granuli]|uniref:outer membrane protein n=1 Tax=Kaistia granuli TaxID=363259 RepID=UPI0004777483|nr:outer membrane protein [Kaistia granuli]